MVAFSFGLRAEEQEPNPCNRRLAAAVQRLLDEATEPVLAVVSQWEVALALPPGVAHTVVGPQAGRRYLDTERVWQAAVPTLHRADADRVIAVAQPLLHRVKAHRLIRQSGFTPVRARVGRIGFDASRDNTQWWTRGPVRLVVYAVLQTLTGRGGR